jgi:hypothetical protein
VLVKRRLIGSVPLFNWIQFNKWFPSSPSSDPGALVANISAFVFHEYVHLQRLYVFVLFLCSPSREQLRRHLNNIGDAVDSHDCVCSCRAHTHRYFQLIESAVEAKCLLYKSGLPAGTFFVHFSRSFSHRILFHGESHPEVGLCSCPHMCAAPIDWPYSHASSAVRALCRVVARGGQA